MKTEEHPVATLPLIGGSLCLDFTNTVGSWGDSQPSEWLDNYAGLVAWSCHAGALDKRNAPRLLRAAARQPEDAARVYARAVALRAALYGIFRSRIDGKRARIDQLAVLNGILSGALAQARLAATPNGIEWSWMGKGAGLDCLLWPLARSAAELLTSPLADHLRHCANDTCGWLFVDMSRNGSRRWCSMSDCGNRAKARQYLARHRAWRKSSAR
jgi:predicted RNA-binding Zn ribbon-like protein